MIIPEHLAAAVARVESEREANILVWNRSFDEDSIPELEKAIGQFAVHYPDCLVVLHTPPHDQEGAMRHACNASWLLKCHFGIVNVYVPFEAKGAGFLIALGANYLYMDDRAMLGRYTHPWNVELPYTIVSGMAKVAIKIAQDLSPGRHPIREETVIKLLDDLNREKPEGYATLDLAIRMQQQEELHRYCRQLAMTGGNVEYLEVKALFDANISRHYAINRSEASHLFSSIGSPTDAMKELAEGLMKSGVLAEVLEDEDYNPEKEDHEFIIR